MKTKKNISDGLTALLFAVIFALAFVACPEPEEEGGPTSYGDKLEFTNEQVYVGEQKIDGNNVAYEFKPYTGADITFDSVYGATPKIVNGKFSFSVGAPAAQYLESISEWFPDDDTYTDLKISDTTVKYVTISYFIKDSASLQASLGRQNIVDFNGTVSESGSIILRSATVESVSFVYVDKDVTITGKEKTKTVTYETGATYIDKYNDINLSLEKGWNTVCQKTEVTILATGSSFTYTQSVSNPSSAKWLLGIISSND
jgi:hypothetical protein